MTSPDDEPELAHAFDGLEEMSDEEWNIRQQLLGLVAQAAYDNVVDYIEDGVVDEELVMNQIDEHVGTLETMDTDFLLRHVLLTLSAESFHEA